MNKQFSNALLHETSPYLLQHAHNPVNWYPWGEEALSLSRTRDLPILVSIGYSACHWCHVMERESFENEEVAKYMNEQFVNIKIDREERPDLDHIYMDAVQAMTGSGGWPLNVFITPEGRPFYGGTYFPPVQAFNKSSWIDILRSITQMWQQRRDEVELQAHALVEHIQKSNNFAAALKILPTTADNIFFSADSCKQMAKSILDNADTGKGGFGQAPKFLQTFSMQYLLSYSFYSGDVAARDHVTFTLERMLNGGIFDQLAGGISRYSTDNDWLVPHFEKMLYDNALFVIVLCEAYQLTGLKTIEKGLRHTLNFLLQEMKNADGGYYTALDADSEGVEGKFYVWGKAEIVGILGDDAELFCEYYNVTDKGNWEETNILHTTATAVAVADLHGIPVSQFEETMAGCRTKLLERRSNRIRPGTDDKILLSSNALLISAYCKAYAALQQESFKDEAIQLMSFIEARFKDSTAAGMYMHTYKAGVAKVPAFLDDYAYLIQACLHLQEITSDQQYLLNAKDITTYLALNYSDEQDLFFFYTHKDHKDAIARKVEVYDGATPSANAVMASNLLYLGIVFDLQHWHIRAQEMIKSLSSAFLKHPSSFGVWANAYQSQTAGINEVVISGINIENSLKQLLKEFLPNKILQASIKQLPFPLLESKEYLNDATIYLCKNYECKQPVTNIGEIINSIMKPVF